VQLTNALLTGVQIMTVGEMLPGTQADGAGIGVVRAWHRLYGDTLLEVTPALSLASNVTRCPAFADWGQSTTHVFT
jgi:hypothetical protein